MVRDRVVVAVREPETPVIVMVDVPTTVAQPAVKVSTLLPVVGLVPKVAATPLGSPDAASVTAPVKPPEPVTVMVSDPVLPGVIAKEATDGASVKLPVPPPQVTPLTANEVGTAFVVPFQVPLNPMPERLPPAAMLPL